MEPGVPFALVGAVQLLVVVAAVGLAVAGWLRRNGPGVLVSVGALVLVVVEVRTALRLGIPMSDDLALLRAAGSLVLAAGLYAGGLGPRRVPTAMLGVVVPLSATGGPSAFAAVAGLLAAAAVVVNRRDLVGWWLALGLTLWAGASALMPFADQGRSGPLAVVLLRGAGALALVCGQVLLARRSLLSKVVSAILAGVVTMAVAAVGVVGNVVVSSYDQQARDTVQSAAAARLTALNDLSVQVSGVAQFAAAGVCKDPGLCQAFLSQVVVNGQSDFVVRVGRNGVATSLAGRPALTASEVLSLRSLPVVKAVLTGTGSNRHDFLADNVRLTGQLPEVAVVGVAAGHRATGQAAPDDVVVYGIRIDTEYTRRDVDFGGFFFSLLAGDPLQVVASNLSANGQSQLLRIVNAHGTDIPMGGVTIGSQGANPTVAIRPIQDNDAGTVALLTMTRDPGPALKTERDALRLLLATALAALVGVAIIAVLLGRRTVDPVRRLTAAAERVAAGDLSASVGVGVTSLDEVGTLSRTFDAMTGSLTRLTGDLRDSAARLETVLASMTDGLLATDGSGAVTSVNRAALGMLGVDEVDVLGERLDLVADVRDAAGNSLVRLSSSVLDEPAHVHRPDGSTVPVRVVLTPLTDADGVVLVLRDTTREREVERMKTEFLSNVSHELRTPLTPIRGYAEILVSKSGLDPEKVRSFATTIRDESLKMNRVVDLLVDVASVEAGRVHASPRAVSVRELLDARVAAWEVRAPERTFKRRVAGGLPQVLVDPGWVAKALDELIDNAVKHTPSGTITLVGTPSPDGTHVRVAVRDAGPGISVADQARLFTSFEQVDGSATRRVGGLGLGLSFVRRLADDAGYPLTVRSVVGKGSEFALDLPPA
jgi:PAS domain S-box-containing protein